MSAPILVVQTAFLGDLLLSTVLLREVRRARPKAEIHLVCRKGFGTLIKGLGLIDEIHEIKKGDAATYKVAHQSLEKNKYEWILCPHPSIRSAQFVQGLFAGHSLSFNRGWNLLHFSKTVIQPDLPDPLRQLSLLRPVVKYIDERFGAWEKIDWNAKTLDGFLTQIPDELSLEAKSKLLRESPVTPVAPRTWGLFPGSVWPTKQWPELYFEQLAEKLLQDNAQVLWLGGPDEKEVCDRLAQRLPRTRSLAGQLSLWESLVVMSRLEGVIANDSGGQHMAAIAGLPVLSIFGPTVLEFGFRPWSPMTAVAEREELFCRPCGPHGSKKCPRGTHECLTELAPEKVFGLWQSMTRKIRSRG
jgi:heptosyltransferase-2